MSRDVPLAVRLWGSASKGVADVHITDEIKNLSFGTSAPGGFAACTLSLNRPIAINPQEFGQFGRLYVYDTRSAEVVWEGRLDDPAKSSGTDGEVWNLTAVGGSAHVNDMRYPLIYVDRSLDGWEPIKSSSSALPGDPIKSGVVEAKTDTEVLRVQINAQTPVPQNSFVGAAYFRIYEAGAQLGAFGWSWDAGGTTTNYSVRGYTWNGDGVRFENLSTAGAAYQVRSVGTNWPAGRQIPVLCILRVGATETPAVDSNWVEFADVVVSQITYTQAGVLRNNAGDMAGRDYVYSSDVVEDLLGRYLKMYDGAGAYVQVTGYAIQQLAYPDGASPADVLDDLAKFDPGYYWAAWESNPLTHKWRFEYRSWPTAPKYEASIVDGFEDGGGSAELYNSCRVRYRNRYGRLKMASATQTVPVLDSLAGGPLTRNMLIDAGDTTAVTAADATRQAQMFLQEHRYPANAGRLRVSRPIWDLERSCYVQPWELKAGNLIRVQGVLPNPDYLNSSSVADERDAVTVFRIVATNYDQSDNTNTLELDSYSMSTARALARLRQRFDRIRRR